MFRSALSSIRGRRSAPLAAACLLALWLVPAAAAAEPRIPALEAEAAFPQLRFARPVDLDFGPPDAGLCYLLEQDTARILVFDNDPAAQSAGLFMDLSDRVNAGSNEEGLLALALAPDFAESGVFYCYYTAARPRRGVLSRFRLADGDPRRGDPASEAVLISVDQPWGNHNGADLQWGPDGYLYFSLGDGGAAHDPHGNGQKLGTLLGSILRIDPARSADGKHYAVPDDNPFLGRAGARPEIWAYGLRNVWRMSFDAETGELWAGDVGQNAWEEIDIIERGGNYGWNYYEASHVFQRRPDDLRKPDQHVPPVFEYPHDRRSGGMSVTGGYVYRGERYPAMQGVYYCGDFATGRFWGLRREAGRTSSRVVLEGLRTVSSFAQDHAGELYCLTFGDPRTRSGQIHRLIPSD